jgi:hypothetical protein
MIKHLRLAGALPMPGGDTPGKRVSVAKYEVPIRIAT